MKKWIFLLLIAFSTSSFCQTYIRDAELGDKDAQYRLGRMYEKADRMPKDISKALYWYSLAADQNQPKAIQALAELYFYGVEVERKPRLAFTLFTKSAEEFHNIEAYYCLAEMYFTGQGTTQDYNKAFSYYKKAADEGNLAKAQYKVGVMLFEGNYVKENKQEGVRYIKLAFNNGYPNAYEYWKEKQMWKYEK
ncbi:MAG: sel1 repeat family protein [Bacteroidales bacterium]|jgi:TPR repeat protein|nr:sel1 repeat family protein [Bacteroidales bacterium]